jgi:hypothetical protein
MLSARFFCDYLGSGSIGTGARFVPLFLSVAKQPHRAPVGTW